MKLIQLLKEIKVNPPHLNITIYDEEYDTYYMDEKRVISLLSPYFPNNISDIIEFVDEINDYGTADSWEDTPLWELKDEFKRYLENK
jgi:hypothetical protein